MKKIIPLLLLCSLSSVFAGNTTPSDDVKKQTVIDFYETALNQKNFEKAKQYMGNQYIQHNPLAKDGIEGFGEYINYLKDTFPYSHNAIKRVLVDGDYVILHVHSVTTPQTKGQAIIDIFRLEDMKIVEHWDVIQAIPETAANTNGMF